MTEGPLRVDLAPDCELLRLDVIRRHLPSVFELDAGTARTLSREANLALRDAWQPPVEGLPVRVADVSVPAGIPAMRQYLPEGADPDCTVLWLHGGGWVLGDLDTTDAPARTACALTGWEVLSVDYRCAPVDRFPAAAHDALAAAEWALRTGRRVIVAGDSAGGNLAAVVAQQLGAHPGLVAQVLVYPATDPSLSFPSAREFVSPPLLTRRDMQWYYEQYLQADQVRDPLVDVMSGLDASSMATIPTLVYTVGHDPLRDEGIAYAGRLRARGHRVEWIHAPEQFHGSFTQSGILPSSAARVAQVWAAVPALLA